MSKDDDGIDEKTRLRRRRQDESPAVPHSSANEQQRLFQELRDQQIELQTQNEELQKANKDLEAAVQNLRELCNFAPIGYATLNGNGTVVTINATGASMLGEDESGVVGRELVSFAPNHERRIERFLAEVFLDRCRHSCEVAIRTAEDNERCLHIEAQAMKEDTCRVALSDITDLHQEQLFRLQVEAVEGYAIYLIDTQGTVLNWNAGAERLEGYRAAEIVGRHFSCLYQEKDRIDGKPEQELRKATTEGRFAEECWRIRKDGTGFWADVVLTPLRDENNDIWGFSKVTHDITERKKAAEALSYSEARYRALFEDNPTMIFILDTDWTILSANTFAATELGYSNRELVGNSVLMLFHSADHQTVISQLEECLAKSGQILRWQFRKVRKDRRLMWVEETAQAVHDLEGRANILVVCQDITGRKLAEEEREKLLMQLNAILDSITEGVVISDLKGNVLTMNPAALAITGFEDIEQIRTQLPSFQEVFELYEYGGGLVPFDMWPMTRALRRERFSGYELSVWRKDTGRHWIGSFSGTPVYTKSGELILCVITFHDITQRKEWQEALIKSEDKFSKIFQSVPALIAITTPDEGRCIDANERGLQTLGFRREEVLGKTLVELGVWESQAARAHAVALLEETGKVRNLEITFRGKDGRIFTGIYTADFIYLNGNRYIINIVNDITERKEMEAEIARLNQDLLRRASELEAANKELEAFNFTVAHDLRQPINIINSACQVIKAVCGEELEADCKEYLGMIYQNTLRMDSLIDALLTFSRIGHLDPAREKVNLSCLANEIAATLKLSEPERQVDVLIEQEIVAQCDPRLTRTLLENLFGNAWKYTRACEKPTIEFGVQPTDRAPVYFVRDNGAGFDMSQVSEIFIPFHRLPGAEKQGGFGIGLATVERIVRRHGGKIWAEGAPGMGATFFFTLSGETLRRENQKAKKSGSP